jgi:hypothetical protein
MQENGSVASSHQTARQRGLSLPKSTGLADTPGRCNLQRSSLTAQRLSMASMDLYAFPEQASILDGLSEEGEFTRL